MKDTANISQENEPHVSVDSAESILEQMLIARYLAGKGYTLSKWRDLPPEQARQLMVEACRYAALRLTEIDTNAHLWSEVHGSEKSF
jgi:hypothetical protein